MAGTCQDAVSSGGSAGSNYSSNISVVVYRQTQKRGGFFEIYEEFLQKTHTPGRDMRSLAGLEQHLLEIMQSTELPIRREQFLR